MYLSKWVEQEKCSSPYMSSAMVCCQNPFSISHRCDTVTSRPTGWLDSDSAVMVDRLATAGSRVTTQLTNCVVTMLYWQLIILTTPSLSSHLVVTVQLSDWWNRSFPVYIRGRLLYRSLKKKLKRKKERKKEKMVVSSSFDHPLIWCSMMSWAWH